jgi:hypothetical protein
MSKPVERECPACHKNRVFRADQKTCGCRVQPKPAPDTDVETFLRAKLSEQSSELKALKREAGSMKELMASVLTSVRAMEPLEPVPYRGASPHENELAAVLKLSDWHIGAVTPASATEGFGAFDWATAQTRVEYITQKFLGWIETHRRSFKIPKLYILSEGDMISGDIHYELQVTNEFPAPVAAVRAGSLLAKTVATLAPHFPEVHFSQINIDNHSRLTKKLQFAQGDENSWGYIVHAITNALLAEHTNIQFQVAPGIRQVVDIVGQKVLTEHGHVVKAWNGIPFYGIERLKGREADKRMRAMLEQERHEIDRLKRDIGFDYMSIGHWHTPGWLNGIIMNGCLPGTTEYDHAAGRYAPPAQVSFLMHPKYGHFDLTAWRPRS